MVSLTACSLQRTLRRFAYHSALVLCICEIMNPFPRYEASFSIPISAGKSLRR